MKNVLLLAMSTLGREIKDNYYRYQDGEVFTAQSQLEPITHMLSDERKKKGERLDKIIILETDETLQPHDGKKSAVGFYKERVGRFLDETVEYVDIPINENEPAEGIRKATSIILQEHEEQKKINGEMNLWIDTQGGFRDVVMVFNAIISLLREQGIEPEGIYSIRYSNTNTEENPCPIINQTKKYDIFKFVSAMQEFMDFGKATGFKKYYGEKNDFVQAIDGIADAIQMCQPQKFEEALQKFAYYLKSGHYKNDDPYLQIFVEFMKNDYGILLEEPDNTIEQVRWCVRKEFYQQAMTIYIEKMPKYYHEKGLVTLKIDPNAKSGYGKNPYADAFYEGMFDEMIERDEDKESLINILKDLVSFLEKNKEQGVKVKERQSAIQYLNTKLRKGDLSQNVSTAIDRVREDLEQRFECTGNPTMMQLQSNTGKTVQKYINHVCGNNKKCHQFLYGSEFEKEGTNEKKIRAIKAAREKRPELVKIMEYYLAMKLLRNRMNHASDEVIKEDEKKAIEFLKSEQIDIGIKIKQDEMQIDYQKIKELITDGLDL